MQSYLYFCEKCGGDTASYNMLSVCPYCHAHEPALQMLDKFNDSQADMLEKKLMEFRANWMSRHSQTPGELQRKKRRFSRGGNGY